MDHDLPTTESEESMAENEHRTIDPNAANVEALTELPGIGPVMAQRIIDARPYERAGDLTRVKGIGPSTLARLEPRLAFDGLDGEGKGVEIVEAKAPDMQATYEVPSLPKQAASRPIEAEQAAADVGGPETPSTALEEVPELETPLEPALQSSEEAEVAEPPVGPETALGGEPREAQPAGSTLAAPTAKEARPVRRGWVLWTVAGSALLVLILSLALNLGVLASINSGRLQFASPAELGKVSVRVDGLDARAVELGKEVQGLRARLDNVEAFGGRIDALEGGTQQLRADLEDTASEVQGLSGEVSDLGQELDVLSQDLANLNEEVAGLQGQVRTLQEQTARTQSFFDGLRDLLDKLFAPEGGAK